MRLSYMILVLLPCIFLIPQGEVRAHGSGASFEEVVDGVLIDIGYSPVDISAQTPVPFDFSIADAVSGDTLPYSDIWVRVHKGRETFFAGGIGKSAVGATTMLFQFPKAGMYMLSVRFQNGTESVAEATFEVPVSELMGADAETDSDHGIVIMFVAFLLGLILGGGALWYILRKKLSLKI